MTLCKVLSQRIPRVFVETTGNGQLEQLLASNHPISVGGCWSPSASNLKNQTTSAVKRTLHYEAITSYAGKRPLFAAVLRPKKPQSFQINQSSVTAASGRAVTHVAEQWCSPDAIIASDNYVLAAESKDKEMCNDEAWIRPQEGRCGWKIEALVSSVGCSISWWQLETKAPEATKPAVTQTTSAAMIHPARIEELYFSKKVQRTCWGQGAVWLKKCSILNIKISFKFCAFVCVGLFSFTTRADTLWGKDVHTKTAVRKAAAQKTSWQSQSRIFTFPKAQFEHIKPSSSSKTN